MPRLVVRALLATLLLGAACRQQGEKLPEWKRPVSVVSRVARVVRNHLPGWGPEVAPPTEPASAVVIEPGGAAPGATLRCLRDGAPVDDAQWTVDGAPGPAGAALTAPPTAGAVITCAAGEVRSRPVVVHGDLPTNVLFILLDDVGVADVSAWGMKGSARTPRIDALAAEGVRFERAWAEPVCSPTRASLMSGLHPMNHGLGVATSDEGTGISLDDRVLSVAEVAAARGATSAGAFGKWHLGSGAVPDDHPTHFGFQSYVITPGNVVDEGEDYHRYELIRNGERTKEEGYVPIATVEAAQRFIGRQTGPWFAWVALNLAHAPFHQPPLALSPKVDRPGGGDKYAAMVQAADTLIGRLLDSIAPDVLAHTVVIVMGDNGAPEFVARPPLTSDHAKSSVFEGGVRVPLVVWGPSIVGRGRVIQTPVGAVDLLPTVADLLGRPLDDAEAAQVDGTSFADALWTDHLPRDDRSIYAEIFGPNTHDVTARRNHRRAVSDGRFKLISSPEGEQLFDLREDPWEKEDLLKRPGEPPPALDRLRGLLETRYQPRPWPRPDWAAE